jgi:hypothetical protein
MNMPGDSDTEVQDTLCHVFCSIHLFAGLTTHLCISKLKINLLAATQISCLMTSFPADKKRLHMLTVCSFFFVRSENTYMRASLLFTDFHGERL